MGVNGDREPSCLFGGIAGGWFGDDGHVNLLSDAMRCGVAMSRGPVLRNPGPLDISELVVPNSPEEGKFLIASS